MSEYQKGFLDAYRKVMDYVETAYQEHSLNVLRFYMKDELAELEDSFGGHDELA